MSVEKKIFFTLSGFSLLFNNLTPRVMDNPFIVAHIAYVVWKQAKRASNGELRTVIGEGDDYNPIYLDAKEEKTLKEYLRNYFGPDIKGTF